MTFEKIISTLHELANSDKIILKTHPALGLKDESGLVGHWTFDAKDGRNQTNVGTVY